MACETATKTNLVMVFGEITTRAKVCTLLPLQPAQRLLQMTPGTRSPHTHIAPFVAASSAQVDYEKVVRDTVRNIGFTSDDVGLDADKCKVRADGWAAPIYCY